jgi:ADP-heptose:LPS heptosyltransferase
MPEPALSVHRMRLIDHWVGLPLCVLLGVVRRLRVKLLRLQPHPVPERPRRILVLKFFGLGSIIMASPLLRAVRERYPDSPVIFLTFGGAAALVDRFGLCQEVHALRTDGLRSFAADVIREVLWLRRHAVDICIDLEFFSKFSTLMSVLSWAPVRVAFQLNDFWRASLVTHPVYYNYYRHVTEVYADASAAVGAVVQDRRPVRLPVDPSVVARCRERLRAAGWNGVDRLIGVNVNAGDLSLERRWPAAHFAALIERLARVDGVGVVLTGSREEAEYVESVRASLSEPTRSRVFAVAGRFDFQEFVASMDLYEFFVTNDSGPLHVAAAQGVDTISVWGATKPGFYGPQAAVGTHRMLYRNFPCSPCVNMFTTQAGQWCGHRADCMHAITVDDVWEAVEGLLGRRREAGVAEGDE